MIIQPTKIIPLLGIEYGMTVLDMGSSVGFWSKRISEIVGNQGKVIAVDYHPEIVQRLSHDITELGITNIHPITGDILKLSDLSVKKESCDKVLVIRMVPIIEENIEQKIFELLAFIKEQGSFIIVDTLNYKDEIETILRENVETIVYSEILEIAERTDNHYFGLIISRNHHD